MTSESPAKPTKNERIKLLEEQVRGLQHQINLLQQAASPYPAIPWHSVPTWPGSIFTVS